MSSSKSLCLLWGRLKTTILPNLWLPGRCTFHFLRARSKCGAAALDVAGRQNAHSLTLAVRGIVELFRLVKREEELHQEILLSSISHDNEAVRMHGLHALINGNDTSFYLYPIKKFDFTNEDGKEKWVAYTFTRNVNDIWMPTHLRRIRSAIDKPLRDINFEPSQSASSVEGSKLQNS
jgi:hypothetical protein